MIDNQPASRDMTSENLRWAFSSSEAGPISLTRLRPGMGRMTQLAEALLDPKAPKKVAIILSIREINMFNNHFAGAHLLTAHQAARWDDENAPGEAAVLRDADVVIALESGRLDVVATVALLRLAAAGKRVILEDCIPPAQSQPREVYSSLMADQRWGQNPSGPREAS